MNVAIYMDEHVHVAITSQLRRKGVDVLTIQEDAMTGRTDTEIFDRAMALGRIVFTNDVDYPIEAVRRQRVNQPFGGVVYAHQLLVNIGQCAADLELIAKASELDEWANRLEYLPL